MNAFGVCIPPTRAARRVGPRGSASGGFTLIELLTVIVIILILAGLLLPAVQKAREKGRQARCMENLRQFSLAVTMFRDDNEGRLPDWLSSLHPRYVPTARSFVCPSDMSDGAEGSKPDDAPADIIGDQFSETDDLTHNPAITACSYLYEASAASCGWWSSWLNGTPADLNGDGDISWQEAKLHQLRTGDTFHSEKYDETSFPLIRCFQHWRERKIRVNDPSGGGMVEQGLTLNVAWAGNVFQGPIHWELFGGVAQ